MGTRDVQTQSNRAQSAHAMPARAVPSSPALCPFPEPNSLVPSPPMPCLARPCLCPVCA
jgi:hypothetical protein